MKALPVWVILAATAALAFAAACGSSGGPSGPPAELIQKATTASGDSQTAGVTAALPNSLRVLVSLSGAPHKGDMVTWAASGTGASVSPATSATDANGLAATSWTLGQTAGIVHATASLSGATGSPVTFTATATPGPATTLALSSGDAQVGVVNDTLPNPLVVKASDQYGNGTSGTHVNWAVTSGSATVSPTSSTTNASGLGQTTVTLGGTAGTITITATSVPALSGSPVTFHDTTKALPTTAAVNVGNIFFKSARNMSSNPAVDTIAVGGTVTWTWVGGTHSVRSTSTPGFPSSATQPTPFSYSNTFQTAGVYTYDCAVHGAAMTGVVVVR